MEFDGWRNKLGSYTAPQRRQTEMASFGNFNRFDNSKMSLDTLNAINSTNQAVGAKVIGLKDKIEEYKNRPKGLPDLPWLEDNDKAPPLPGQGFVSKHIKPKLGWLGKGIGMFGSLFGGSRK